MQLVPVAQPLGAITVDSASVMLEEGGKRYRLPKNGGYLIASEGSPLSIQELVKRRLGKSLAIGGTCRSSSVYLGNLPKQCCRPCDRRNVE